MPASERIFSIFEDHVELIKHGRRDKLVECGHAVVLIQTKEKFITLRMLPTHFDDLPPCSGRA